MRTLKLSMLLVVAVSCASAFPKGTQLPVPSIVQSSKFTLKPTQLDDKTEVVVFFYSASWCGPCKAMGDALKQAYSGLREEVKGMEFVTYSVDFSPRARADYLRESRLGWPALSPEVIDEAPWLKKVDGGTPQFQAFRIEGANWVAMTDPGDVESVINAVAQASKSKPVR